MHSKKDGKNRNQYKQVQHLSQDTTWKIEWITIRHHKQACYISEDYGSWFLRFGRHSHFALMRSLLKLVNNIISKQQYIKCIFFQLYFNYAINNCISVFFRIYFFHKYLKSFIFQYQFWFTDKDGAEFALRDDLKKQCQISLYFLLLVYCYRLLLFTNVYMLKAWMYVGFW